jgi:hypothetical protein
MKNDAVVDRIAELQKQIDELKSQIAPPAPVKIAQPKAVEDEGVVVSYPAPVSLFEMPDDAQLDRLAQIVFTKFPALRPTFSGRWAAEDQREFDRGFRSAFFALGHIERREEVDRKRALSYWSELAEQTCRALGTSASISGSALLCAAVAAGDIKFILPDVANGVVAELALCHGSNMGRLPTNQWKSVLKTGQVLPPVTPPRSQNYSTPPFRIDYVA